MTFNVTVYCILQSFYTEIWAAKHYTACSVASRFQHVSTGGALRHIRSDDLDV